MIEEIRRGILFDCRNGRIRVSVSVYFGVSPCNGSIRLFNGTRRLRPRC